MTYWVILATWVFAGLLIGSFLNVVIWRGPAMWGLIDDEARGDLVKPRSYCPSCKAPVKRISMIPVLGYLTSRLRSREDAEDVASDVFHKLVTSLDKYDPERGSVQAWIMTMARNTLIDHMRRVRPTESIDDVAEMLADGAPNALGELIEQEDARFAYGILRHHPPIVREMFSLHFAHGMPYRDIATALGLSESAVKQRFSRTLRELREELGARKKIVRALREDVRGAIDTSGAIAARTRDLRG